jgi:ABC-2 type transport system ATP-binding protein
MMAFLEVRQLRKTFGELRAVDDVSFEVREGELYGLLGPNGAGKTTTLSMISGLLRPDSGKVTVSGADFWQHPEPSKRLMGVVPQEITLYEELTARENLEFWGRLAGLDAAEARSRSEALLQTLALADRAREPIKKFSGGMKRRLNVGCALLHRPRLVLLDEPTVGIDPQARLNLLDFIRSLRDQGTAVLYTTHYLEEAESLCDRIGIIDHGRLLAEGSLEQLRARLGGAQLFQLEGNLNGATPAAWPGFQASFKVIQQSEHALLVASTTPRDPAECLRDLLALPIKAENVTLKRPSLNDVFIQLTGRALRE